MTTKTKESESVSEAKCPKCNGVPQCAEIPNCRGCHHCDFVGTMAAYLANRELMKAAELEEAKYYDLKRRGICPTCKATCPKEAETMCQPHAIADTGDHSCAGEDLWQNEE